MKLAIILLLFSCALSAQSLVPIQAGRDMSSLRNGLVGWWKMDEGNLGTTINDFSGGSHNGVIGGPAGSQGTWQWYSSGQVGLWSGSLVLPPASVVGPNITVADNAAFQFGTGDFSFSAWIYPFQTSAGVSHQLTVVNKTFATGFECAIYEGHFNCNLGGTGFSGSIPINSQIWYLATVTRKSGVFTSYINGVLDNSATINTNVSGVGFPVVFGARQGSSADYYNGLIDDARLYNRALTLNEIKQLYSSQNVAIPSWARVKLIADMVITNNHILFNDGTDGWTASPYYGTTTTFLDDLTLTMIGNRSYFTAPQIQNIIVKTLAARNGNGDFPGSLNQAAVGGGFVETGCGNPTSVVIQPDINVNAPLMEKAYYLTSGSTSQFSVDAALLKTALTNGSVQLNTSTHLVTVPSGVLDGTYTSGGTIVGIAGQTITLAIGGPGSGATATATLTGVNTIAGGTNLAITAAGTGYTSVANSATCSNGTAVCSGTVTITTRLQIYPPWAGMDGVQFTGDNMYATVHYYDALLRMAELYTAIGDSTNATWATNAAALVSSNIATLWDATDGMFYASSGQNHQIDILGSSYAVAVGLATPTQSTAISNWLTANYSAIVLRGLVRQSNANWAVSWISQCTHGTGNYDDGVWGYGLGYIATAMAYANPATAVRLVNDAVVGPLTLENVGQSAIGATSNMMSPQGLVKFVNDNPSLFH